MDSALSYGITPARDIMRLQREHEEARERRTRPDGGLTYETAVADAHEALVGLSADLSGTTERTSLASMLLHENRMRGLGILCIMLALVGLVADYILQ